MKPSVWVVYAADEERLPVAINELPVLDVEAGVADWSQYQKKREKLQKTHF